jgi:hypothetical protein
MLHVFNKLIANQYEAALCTLNACVDECPDTAWNGPVVNLKSSHSIESAKDHL